MDIALAVLLGGAFGFVLQRIGATNATHIINMLALTDLRLAKVILLSLALSSAAVYGLQLINPDLVNLSVKTTHAGVIIGGLIFGLGFAIAGYCPGTSLGALGEGKIGAVFFVAGGLLGALAFTLFCGTIADSWLFRAVAGGKTTLADTGIADYPVLIEVVPALAVALILVMVLAFTAWKLPEHESK